MWKLVPQRLRENEIFILLVRILIFLLVSLLIYGLFFGFMFVYIYYAAGLGK